jgi:hypothetical protein
MVRGNFQDYEEDKRRRLGADADQPHRLKFKPLTGADSTPRQDDAPPGDGFVPAVFSCAGVLE